MFPHLPKDAPEVPEEPGLDQFDQFDQWRFDYFISLTGDERLAGGLVRMKVSPHELEDLLKAGCGLDDALRIVAPL